ncbi:MAG: hypothetical protein HYX53_18015 [Chloroflexi bacterium]|nr:hypothetical protein [Chloroflexota bacterium]
MTTQPHPHTHTPPGARRPRKRRLVILGLPYFGRMLARLLAARGWDTAYVAHPGHNPVAWLRLLPRLARADVVYLIGSRLDRRSPQDLLARVRRRPIVVHWVGTDVLIATEEHARANASAALSRRATHWCDAPWLAGELAAIGIAAEHVALPVEGLAAVAPPLPAHFRVLLYLPVDAFDREVFDMATLLELPRRFPDIAFTLIPSPAATLPAPLPPNLEAHGWVDDMDALYRDVTVVVRLTTHDGTSFMALEALSRGRYVIWTYPLPGAVQASGLEPVAAAIESLAARYAAGSLSLNDEGIAFAREHFQPARATTELDRRLRAVLRAYLRAR